MPSKKGLSVRDKALALSKQGLSARAITEKLTAEGHKVGKSAVAEWCRTGRATRAATHRAKASGSAEAEEAPAPTEPVAAPTTAPTPIAPTAPAPTASSLDQLDTDTLDIKALEEVDRQVGEFIATAHMDGDVAAYVKLVDLRMRLRAQLVKLRPPPKADPLTDPLNLDARRIVLARIQGYVQRQGTASGGNAET